ncbi:MAG: hypothetical protein AB7L66_07960 [Gemmatimonadales bacterium]
MTGRRAWLVLAGLALGAACASGPSEPELDFYTRVVFGFPSLVPEVTAGSGEIVVTGLLATKSAGFTLHGELLQPTPRSLVVKITAAETGAGVALRTQHYFAATIRPLAAVPHDLTLIYVVSGDGRDSTELLRTAVTPGR